MSLTFPLHRNPNPAGDEAVAAVLVNPGFGDHFTDHMAVATWTKAGGWAADEVRPYGPFQMDPASAVLHYGQEIFEGMKAYRGKDGAIYLFRPKENIKRMNVSARRLCMPELDEELFLEALKKLVLLEKDWIPSGLDTAAYIRPTMIAIQPALGVHPANAYLFFIVMGPVGAYYPEGFSPTKIYVSEEYVRSAPGGTGFTKAGGNYAASLYASRIAEEMGYTQVLWLDAVERKYVEEVGTSNIFFLIGDELITPPLEGTILPGVTRDSVIRMARSWGRKVSERRLSMDEILAAHKNGSLKESFASGTAAIVSPVGQFFYKGQVFVINGGKTGPLVERLYNEILQIQYGVKEDPFGWRMKISG